MGHPMMKFLSSTRPSGMFYVLALSGILLTTAFTLVFDLDIWWHLATGWVITNLHSIPKNDIFSYSAFGLPWVNHEWLFQVLSWILYDRWGIGTLTVLKFLLTCALSAVVFRTIVLLTTSRSIALWGVVLLLWTISFRIVERPYLVGLVFFAVFYHILHRYVRGGTRTLWILPLLQIVWINTHGGGLLGPQIVLAFAAGETITGILKQRWGGPPAISREHQRHLWIVALACIAASIANPWGIETLIFPFQHLQMETILSRTVEWLPLLHPHLDSALPPMAALVCFGLTLLSFAFTANLTRPSHLLAVALVSYLLIKSARFVPDFMIVALPLLLMNATTIARAYWPAFRMAGFAPAWLHLAAVLYLSCYALLYGIPVSTHGDKLADIGFGTVYKAAPDQMVDFLDENGISGRVFNDMGLGGYLIFRRWPREFVFIDGRTPIFGDSFYNRFLQTFDDQNHFDALNQEYHFDYLVFSSMGIWRNRGFHLFLWKHPQWRLVYAQRDGMVYVRNEPKFSSVIEKFALKVNPLVAMVEEDRKQTKKQAGEARKSSIGCSHREDL